MNDPVLILMAAGMGSRFGGLKQIEPVDTDGHILMDYSIFDARRAGFRDLIFIIKKENEALFRDVIGSRIPKDMNVSYAFQELTDLPEGKTVPEGRIKPWGTAHAVRSARHLVHGPFAVINADDYYGPESFRIVYDFLKDASDESEKMQFVMAGYLLGNTLTENGHVARGVCETDASGHLVTITERTKIIRREADAAFTEDDGASWTSLPFDAPVSLNMWGFTEGMMREIDSRFPSFLEKAMEKDPVKSEYFLPGVVGDLLAENAAEVTVRMTKDKWYGITYKEDKEKVVAALRAMREEGLYPFD